MYKEFPLTKRRMHMSLPQTLQESEQRFQATFEQAAVGISHVAPDGRFLQVNQKLCTIVGYSHEELLRLTFQDITFPEDVDIDLAFIRRLLSGEIATYSMEKRYIRKDSSFVWVNITVSLVREKTGTPCYFISIIEDIQAHKRAEEERERLLAQEREARLHAEEINRQFHILQALTDTALASMGIDTFVQTLLRRAGESLAVDAMALFVPNLEDMTLHLHTAVGIELEDLSWLQRLLGEEIQGRIVRERRLLLIPDLSVFSPSSLPLRTPLHSALGIPLQFGDQLIGILVLMKKTHPLTEMDVVLAERVADRLALALERFRQFEAKLRTQLEAARLVEVEQANDLLRHFTALTSHEFRSGLTSIQGFSELLQNQLSSLTHERVIEYVQDIHDSTLRLRRITDDILNQQQLQAGQITLKRVSLDLHALVTAVIKSIQPTALQHTFHLESDAMLPLIEGDADKLTQVLLNLLSNAVKYAPHGGEIVVRLQGEEMGVHMQIQDHGIGIPSQMLEKIFAAYERVNSETTRYIGGMGLGLSIVRQIVELHAGKVWAESISGEGSLFHVTLPSFRPETEREGLPA